MIDALGVAVAAVGALLVAIGVGLMFAPAGLVVGGVELIGAAYGYGYLRAAGKGLPR